MLGAAGSASAVTVGVDSNQTWLGYMNVFNLPAPNGDGAFQFASSWGTADLVAVFNSGTLTLSPNTIGDPNPYWYTPAGGPGSVGNKIMEANYYVQVDGTYAGQTVNFTGTVLSNTMTGADANGNGWTKIAFIKDFAADFSSFNVISAPLVNGVFNISLATINDPTRHVQYGFQVVGPCVWVTDVAPFGSVVIQDAPAPFVPDQIPNGDFEIADGASWAQETAGPAISFPATGGNPTGHAVIDATVNDNFAAIKAFGGNEKTFASLGLAPGDTFIIQLDMKILEGSNIGGVRLVGEAAYEAPAPPLQRPTPINGGTDWETYSIPITVPATPAKAAFTFVWGFNSKVAYDNIQIVLPGPSAPLQATITKGTAVSWTAASAINRYQAQESANIGGPFTDVGPAIIGNSITSVFDGSTSPFYQVLESVPTVTETAYNGDFSEEGIFPDDAEGWEETGSQAPLRLATGGRTDNGACMQLMVMNSLLDPGAKDSVLLQNTFNVFGNTNGEVVPGNSYDFSLWAKQISKTASYEQRYIVKFLDGIGNILNPGAVFQNFVLPAGSGWVQFTQSGLIAPAGATTALIEIVAVIGADPNESGEVLIDDVTLLSTGFGSPTVLAATAAPAVEVSWPSANGQDYQVQSSPNLVDWSNFGGVIPGDNTTKAVFEPISLPAKFYKVGELP